MRGLVGKKIGMTRIFDDNGNMVPVTVLEAGPCQVTQLKTVDTDGYDAVQVGYLDKKSKHLTKALQGHFDQSGVSAKKIVAEFEKVPGFDYELGQSFHVGIFKEGDYVSLTHVGAYGMSLSSNYNTRPTIAEVMVTGSNHKLIRKRQSLENLVKN